MWEYTKCFLADEDGAEGMAAVCIIACAAVLIAALVNLADKMEIINKRAKKDAVVAGGLKGYGNVKIK